MLNYSLLIMISVNESETANLPMPAIFEDVFVSICKT